MTGPGFGDSFDRFAADLDAAVVRARRVAAEARETSAKFRRDTRTLADKLRTGQSKVAPEELTDDRLRRSATGFRDDHGLPVEKLPEGRDLLQPPPAPQPGHRPPATPGAARPTPPGRRVPPPSDDDEDFSQERIMR